MSETAPRVDLGTVGVFLGKFGLTEQHAVGVEQLGYRALWIGGSPEQDLTIVERVLGATERLAVATGIVNIWTADARAVADSYHRIEAAHPGRFVLGIGVGHREFDTEFRTPYQALVDYLDLLDERGVPTQRRVLAALGPRVLKLAAERSAGAHPYLVPAAYTGPAREVVGPDALLAVEHKVALGNRAATRTAGRNTIHLYLGLSNYLANLRRLGFTEADLAKPGSDALVDALVAQGDASSAAKQLRAHLDAGASHLAVQVVGAEDPLPTLAALAPELL